MAKFTIYHNPRCSKSRQTLELLNDNGADVEIVEYLKNPPTVEELTNVLSALKLSPQEVMRKKEAEYKESGLNNTDLSEEEQIKLMVAFPKVIERPIVVKGKKAVVGRPPENVLKLF
ncbi:arsenate reductase (glutaredoxin) [Aliikangiella sp. IMCC44359]|uniref:arsenate reductase (glutaredoxin) n=1 Tax=Aliikangiella sp. IMCC44359 TaxID=3459125 RepID=UPI00403ADDA3